MSYYEYEYITQNLIDILKEKQDAEERSHKGQTDGMNVNSMMKDAKRNMPAMPSMSSSLSSFPGIPSSLKI
jgi:hypothetical protein